MTIACLRRSVGNTLSHNLQLPLLGVLQLVRTTGPTQSSTTHLHQTKRTVVLLTKLKLVDNSDNAKKVTRLDQPYCIKLPKNRKVAGFGDIIKIAHRGKVHNAMIVSNRKPGRRLPRYDSHNIILLNDKLDPVGTRILGPLPSALRRKEGTYSKVIAIASRFI